MSRKRRLFKVVSTMETWVLATSATRALDMVDYGIFIPREVLDSSPQGFDMEAVDWTGKHVTVMSKILLLHGTKQDVLVLDEDRKMESLKTVLARQDKKKKQP